MKLVIVESPTKGRTISKFLGKDYKVESSYGHIRDLPKSTLGINTEENFEPRYVIPTKVRKVVKQLKEAAQKSEAVILATDEDREGEAIAWHLVQALELEKSKSQSSKSKQIPNSKFQIPVKRIVFHEITKSAIEKALNSPRKIDDHLVDAQQARRVLDRLVGYKLSPFLWKKVVRGLSAGRVQSVALRFIVDRENEIRAFKPEEYWTITAELFKRQETRDKRQAFEANLTKIDGKTVDKFEVKNKEQADKIVEALQKESFVVSGIDRKEVSKHPLPPFITSTMQQEAARRLGFSAKKTMVLAQKLYENGHITYMRTDSVNLSQESVQAAKKWLTGNFGEKYALESPRVFKAKSKLAQEAHEAIRPTSAGNTPDDISLDDAGEQKLYKLIWQRFMASQMPAAKAALTAIDVETRNKKQETRVYGLRATGQQIIFDGYLKIWPQKFSEKDLPNVEEKEELDLQKIVPAQHFTEPPPRYSEATLIKTLEEYGIGRPSTYAPTLSVIQTRNYVQKEAGKFRPTEMGELVNKVMTEHFPKIVDVEFTAKMEEDLDEVAEGKENWQKIIKDFYGPFAKNLEEKYEVVSKKELVPEETTDEKCEKCGKPMIIKHGRFGKFMACSGFPDCKNTKALPKEAPKPIGMKCPDCLASPDPAKRDNPGEIVERKANRGRARGKTFWGCSRYPDCKYASWKDPRKPADEKQATGNKKQEASGKEQATSDKQQETKNESE